MKNREQTPIRILFVIPDNGLIGGTISSLRSILQVLPKERITPFVYSIKHTGSLFEEFIVPDNFLISAYFNQLKEISGWKKLLALTIKIAKRFESSQNRYVENLICKLGMLQIEKKQKYDIVVAFEEHSPAFIVQFSNARKKIAWIHCEYHKYCPNKNLENRMYSKYDKVVCVSNYVANKVEEYFPDLKNKVVGIHNICNFEYIIKKSLYTDKLDSRFDRNHSTFKIISIGRISPEKRFDQIPKIAKELKQKEIVFKWYIIGGTPYYEYVDAITTNMSTYCVEDEVIMLGAKDNPYPYLKEADLLVSLSCSEAFSIVIAEAKVLGKPVITADFPVAYEIIDNGYNGIITSISSMADNIHSIYRNKSRLIQIGQNAKDSMSENDYICRQLYDIFEIL